MNVHEQPTATRRDDDIRCAHITYALLQRIITDPQYTRTIEPLIHPGSDIEIGFQVNQSLFTEKYAISGLGKGTATSMQGAICAIDPKAASPDLYVLLEVHFHPNASNAPSVYEQGAGDLYRLSSLRRNYRSLLGVDIKPISLIASYKGSGHTSILAIQERSDAPLTTEELQALNASLYADFKNFREPEKVRQILLNTGTYNVEIMDAHTRSLFPVKFEITGLEKLAPFAFIPQVIDRQKLDQVRSWADFTPDSPILPAIPRPS